MTRAANEYEIADHERDLRKADWHPRDPTPLDQRCAVAKLIGFNEGLAGSGLLGSELESKLRLIIAETLIAFNMPSKEESDHAQG